jgi:uncharacterized damage-inducible protein DinB
VDLATIHALYRYNSWAHEEVLAAVSKLAPADFTRDLKSSHGSVRDTFTHIVWSEWIWLQRWRGASPTPVFAPADYPTVESIRQRMQAVAADRSSFLGHLSPEQLIRVHEYTNLKGERWRYPLWQQLYHVVNHSTYHRGQVVTMLRRLGATPPSTDFLVYYDHHPS